VQERAGRVPGGEPSHLIGREVALAPQAFGAFRIPASVEYRGALGDPSLTERDAVAIVCSHCCRLQGREWKESGTTSVALRVLFAFVSQ
jgi:hypothetical protein